LNHLAETLRVSHSLSLSGYHRNERCIKISTDSNTKELYSLIEKLNNNDPLAFEEIYKRCSGHVAFVCHKFCDSKEDAEEVVQDTFLIAFKKAGTLKSETFMGYLRKIAIRESLRKRNINLRTQNYVVSAEDEQTENLPELNTDFLPEQHLQDKENRTELLRIIKSLPEIQWEMVYMFYYADFSTKEIALLYNCSESNVYNTLRRARNTIKSKLEGTDSKYSVKGMAVAPLAAILFIEEEIFAASYIPTAAPSIVAADVVGKVATVTSTSTKTYAVAVCVLAVCGVSVAVYFASLPNAADYEPAYDSYAELPIYEEEPIEYEPQDEPYIPYEPQECEPQIYDPPTEEPYEPTIEEEPYEPQAVEQPTYVPTAEEPTEVYEEIIIYEPLEEEPYEPQDEEEPEDEPYEPEPEEEPYEPEPDPIPIDRTAQILAALAQANNAGDVNRIINHYDFVFADQLRRNSTNERFRFYVTNEGSGDILIGIAAYEDGAGWRMRFEHFNNGTMPLDILQLLRFME